MNFVDLSIQFQVKVSEENTGAAANTAPAEHPNHPHPEQMRVTFYTTPSGIVVGKQPGTAQDGFKKALETIKQQVSRNWKKVKNIFDQRPSPTCKQAI
jgi:hypothetical protein